ncbi:MAG: hypothetical protein IJD63_01975 [Oscillospiraceae bacterium]|nr:hypothetical protein [Oscillospiraceae bacterium]
MKRTLSLILLFIFYVNLFCGCTDGYQTVEAKGLTLRIPGYFEDKSSESYAAEQDFLYSYGGMGFLGIREKRSDFPAGYENMGLEAYGNFVIYGNQLSCELTKRDGFYTFTYEKDAPEGTLTYVAIVLENKEAFFTVQAYCLSEFYNENASLIWKCLTSAKVQ